MQINKSVLIGALALVGFFAVVMGLNEYRHSGLTTIVTFAFICGIGLCLCALVLTFFERDEKFVKMRGTVMSFIGFGISGIAIIGINGDPALIPDSVRPGLFVAGIACLCIGYWLSARNRDSGS
jgi:hypothetical protein